MRVLLSIVLFMSSYCLFAALNADVHTIFKKMDVKPNTDISVVESPVVNAYTYFLLTGYSIEINTGLIRAMNIDELAFVVGHEIGHTYVGESEDMADIVGARLMKKAGYNICQGRFFFKKLYKLNGNQGGENDPHSSNRVRFDNVSKIGDCVGTSKDYF